MKRLWILAVVLAVIVTIPETGWADIGAIKSTSLSTGVATGVAYQWTVNSLTTGTGLKATSTGTIAGTGNLMWLYGSGLTTGDALQISLDDDNLTTGKYISLYGGVNLTTLVWSVAEGGATAITPNAAAAAVDALSIDGSALTSGDALQLKLVSGEAVTSKLINAYDGATAVFAVGATGIITGKGGGTIDNTTSATVLNLTETTVQVTGVLRGQFDAAAYWTATQADGGAVTFDSVSDGTSGFTFSDVIHTGTGYAGTGASISAAGVGQFDGALTTAGALTADNIVCTNAATFGGGYGVTGATISTAGVGQFNGALTTDGALTADNIVCTNAATFGGGSGGSGATITTDGAATFDSTLTVTGSSALNGGITVDTTNFTVDGTTGAVVTASSLTAGGAAALNGGITVDASAFQVADTTGRITMKGAATLDNDTSATVLNITEDTVRVTGALDVTGGFTTDTNALAIADTTGVITMKGAATIDNNASATVLKLTETTIQADGILDVTGNSTLASLDVGGGYSAGGSGATIAATGAISANGALVLSAGSAAISSPAGVTAAAGTALGITTGDGTGTGATGYAGGAFSTTTGAGTAGTTTGGAGGATSALCGNGGTSVTGTTGAGGNYSVTAGNSGAASGAGTAGAAGTVTITAGTAGTTAIGTSAAGGNISLLAGVGSGGTPVIGGAGGQAILGAGQGGAGDTGGAGGLVNIYSGAPGAGGAPANGIITMRVGGAAGTTGISIGATGIVALPVSATVGGGYADSGITLSTAGAITADGTITSGRASGATGSLVLAGVTSGGITITPIDAGTGATTIVNQAGTPTITLPATTCTLGGLGLANTWSAANTFSGTSAILLTGVNAAGGSANPYDYTGTLGIMDNSDDFTLFDINLTNADHTGTGNTVQILDIANITGDAQATETAINIGSGWDNGISSTSPITVAGTTSGGITISALATGTAITTIQNQNVAAATITLPSATCTLPGIGLANTWTNTNQFNSTIAGPAEGNMVVNTRHRVTIAQINAGLTLVTAVSGRSFRLVSCKAVAYGGAVGATTTVDILGTQSAGSVKLVAYAQASLTQSTVLTDGDAGAAVLADGASYVTCDANTAITIGKTGADVTTATGVDIILSYVVE